MGNTLLILSGSIRLKELKPVMSQGFKPVLRSAIRERLANPYGEMICFMMLIPCVNKPSQMTRAGYGGILAGGIVLIEVAIAISDIFGLPYRKTLLSCGVIVLLWSQIETPSLSEHFEFGRQSLIYIHPLFVYIFLVLFFLLALVRRSRVRRGNSQKTRPS
ncbi:GerAB/ArcD/ProY family transporter [Paenibacillus peoriae]|uniref:GerAB/ArcD/ProY family transporter n=1 Tax=Paenibacillus peoriae TaxID=59893 RepID=UPI003F95F127